MDGVQWLTLGPVAAAFPFARASSGAAKIEATTRAKAKKEVVLTILLSIRSAIKSIVNRSIQSAEGYEWR